MPEILHQITVVSRAHQVRAAYVDDGLVDPYFRKAV
jgi:hypothetical protein